jgi:hypothetical protein
MNRRIWIWCVLALLAAGASVRAAGSLRIVPIVADGQVLVSFDIADAYTDEVRDAIASGLRTTFTYDIELRMVVPVWVDPTIATAVVSASDRYNNLTRRHSLSRSVDGRVDEVSVTDDRDVAGRWLTSFNRLPLCRTSKLDPSRDYYVRIRAHTRPPGSSLIGWTSVITGQAKFTLIP